MSKQRKFLVIEIDDETTILDEATCAQAEIDEAFAAECYGDNAYWLTLDLKDCTFADQQRAIRDAGGDDTLLPQKRFVVAVEKWSKRGAGADSSSILTVGEDAFLALKPPALGNAVNVAILQAWYPGASKATDFTSAYRAKQSALGEATKSTSTESIPA